MSLRLRPFGLGDEQEALAAHRALHEDGFTFLLGYTAGMAWPDWILDVERTRTGVDIPPDRVRAAFLAAEVDGALVGRVSVRFELNEYLAREGGHVGYGVLPAHRRQGYATEVELTRFPAHPIVSQGSQEGVPDGSPLEVPGRVPA